MEGNSEVILTKGVHGFDIIPPLSGRSSSPQSSGYPQFSRKHQARGRNYARNYQPGPRIPPQMVDNGLGGAPNPDGWDPNSFDPDTFVQPSQNKDPQSNNHQPTAQKPDKNKKKKKKNSREVSRERVSQAYQDFISKMNKKGYKDLKHISEDRFLELSTNPQSGVFDEKSIIEAEGGLQLEVQGKINNLRRLKNPDVVDLDFMAERAGSGETIFLDHKKMIDFGSLSDKGVDISGYPSHETVAFNMGKDSVAQKGNFLGRDQGPESMADVVHLYNFENIRDRTEVPVLIQAVLNGAEQAGYTDGMIFLNYEQ